MLNAIWVGFFLVAFAAALLQFLVNGQQDIFALLIKAGFDSAKTAFDIALGLTGVMCLWLGVMRIGERAGFLDILARWLSPLFSRIFPEVPQGHPALGSITMNMAANMMGLDNAATPIGIKAMQELQELNPDKDTASNAQIMFLVINASSVTLLPVTIFTYRAQMGAADPTDVFVPILMATYCSTLAGFLFVKVMQRIRLDGVVLAWIGGLSLACRRTGRLVSASCAGGADGKVVGDQQPAPACGHCRLSRRCPGKAGQRLRGLRRWGERRVSHRRNHYSLSGGHAGGHRHAQGQWCIGSVHYRDKGYGNIHRPGLSLGQRPADHADEAAFRQRCPGDDGRDHEDLWRRIVSPAVWPP